MNEFSKEQLLFLKEQKKQQRIVKISRILILLSFLFLWEFSANVGWIDSFIFSSPSKIALCFWGMVLDKSIFLHIGVTLYETIISFTFPGSTVTKLLYRLKMQPKIATDIPAVIIVILLAPSHTISRGASADFGRLFNTTK